MNPNPGLCNASALSRFLDHELATDERADVAQHLEVCSHCRRRLSEYEFIRDLYRSKIQRVSQVDISASAISTLEWGWGSKRAPLGRRFKFVSTLQAIKPRRLLVPVAAMAGLLMLALSLTWKQVPILAPSAIVDSFSGDVRSIMIMQTPETHQTIILYKENIIAD